MSKRTTKAETILLEARNRISGAQAAVSLAERALEVARASLDAHREAFNALEKALVSKPRKKVEKPAAGPAAPKDPQPSKEPLCGICGNPEDYQDHFKPSPNYHPFDTGKSVARLVRKSKPKTEVVSSDLSSETSSEGAGVAALAASGD